MLLWVDLSPLWFSWSKQANPRHQQAFQECCQLPIIMFNWSGVFCSLGIYFRKRFSREARCSFSAPHDTQMKAAGISVWKIQCEGIECACRLTWTKNAACHKCQSADMLEVNGSPESHLKLSASTWTPPTFENFYCTHWLNSAHPPPVWHHVDALSLSRSALDLVFPD